MVREPALPVAHENVRAGLEEHLRGLSAVEHRRQVLCTFGASDEGQDTEKDKG